MDKSFFKHINIINFLILFILSSCTTGLNNETKSEQDLLNKSSISQEYWGTWIRMDTGDEYYISDTTIYKNNSLIQNGIQGFSLDNEYVLKNDNLRFFKKGGKNRNFYLTLSGYDNPHNRSISLGLQDISGKRENQTNKSDNEIVKPNNEGTLEFNNAVSGDKQDININNLDNTINQNITVTPSYDGENLGSIPILGNNKFGYKITYSINGDEQGCCYGNYYANYNLVIHINNIGIEESPTSYYEITCDDPKVNFSNISGNLSNIKPQTSKDIKIEIRYGELKKEFIDVPIKINITDSKYNKVWKDAINVRFYKGVIPLYINTRNFDNYSNSTLNGFIIYPDGKSKRFISKNSEVTKVLLPWSEKDYILAFSGATYENEMGYSFCLGDASELLDLSGTWELEDINAFEYNDSVNLAHKIPNSTSAIKGYLKNNDIDFYSINNSKYNIVRANGELNIIPLKIQNYCKQDYNTGSYSGSWDYDYVSMDPGEDIFLNISIKNPNNYKFPSCNVQMVSDSPYIIIDKNKNVIEYSEIDPFKIASRWTRRKYGDIYYHESDHINWPFKFSIKPNAPVGTKFNLDFIFTEVGTNNSFTDSICETIGRDMVNDISIKDKAFSDSKSISNLNNGNNVINPGETIWMDLLVAGSYMGYNYSVKMVCKSPYVTLINNSYDYSCLAKYSSAKYSNEDLNMHTDWLEPDNPNLSPFKFIVAKDTPANTKLELSFIFTNSKDYIWVKNIILEVTK